MDKLIDDIVNVIISLLGPKDLLSLASVNREYRRRFIIGQYRHPGLLAYMRLASLGRLPGNKENLLRPKLIADLYSQYWGIQAIYEQAQFCRAEVLEHYKPKPYPRLLMGQQLSRKQKMDIMYIAAMCGNVVFAKWFVAMYGIKKSRLPGAVAMQYGKLKFLHWLSAVGHLIRPNIMIAVRYGQLNVVKWFVMAKSKLMQKKYARVLLQEAILYCRPRIVKWLYHTFAIPISYVNIIDAVRLYYDSIGGCFASRPATFKDRGSVYENIRGRTISLLEWYKSLPCVGQNMPASPLINTSILRKRGVGEWIKKNHVPYWP